MKKLFYALTVLLAFAGCESGDFFYDYPSEGKAYGDAYPEAAAAPGGVGQGEQHGQPGVVTAGEWNDLDNWALWSKLMSTKGDEQTVGYADTAPYWRFWTDRRVAITVTSDGEKPIAGVKVELHDGSEKIWEAVTDVLGRADCWIGLHNPDYQQGTLSLYLNGKKMAGEPEVTPWSDEPVRMNAYTVSASAPEAKADVLFIVDSTGSMGDELEFLKADLLDILRKAQNLKSSISIRTGALFYRDEGQDEEYLIRTSPFTSDATKTSVFIKNQSAGGGGDFPEAVHTALEESLQSFDWDGSARARIAFMLLDAPPHQNHQGVVESVNKSIDRYAAMGIKLIPIASSGIDKSTEFLLRMMAAVTEGTYVFITNDSGIGGDHIEPTVGEYQVELLNDLMVRLLQKYLE